MRSVSWVCAVGFAGFALACSSSSSQPAAAGDGGHDATHASTGDSGKGHDGGHPRGHEDAGADAKPATHDAGVDAATDAAAATDASDGGPTGLTCGLLIGCDNKCGGAGACTNACYTEATAVAQGLFNAFTDCLSAQCPQADASSCDTQAATGACVSTFINCENDKQAGPPNPDGGTGASVVDAGGELNCGEYKACVAACPTDAGASGMAQCTAVCVFSATPAAVALAGVLDACLNMACPPNDGGVCMTQGTACAGCQEQAIFAMPNTCAAPFTACEDDRSNASDGGTTPQALQDGGTLGVAVTGITQAASSLVVQDDYLYFAQVESNQQIMRKHLVDGGATTAFGPPQQTPAGIVADSNNVYVWSYGSFSGTTSFNNDDGTVVQIPIGGGDAVTLRTNMEVLYDAPYLNSVAVDTKYVYWVEGAMGADGAILRTKIGSAEPVTLYSGQYIPEALTTDGTNVYWANWGTFDAEGASNNDGTVMQAPVDGTGTPKVLATNQSAPGCILVDANNVYWTNLGRLGADLLPAMNSGSVLQTPIGGGAIITLAAAEAIPVGLAVSHGKVYWTVYGLSVPGIVDSAPIGGGTVLPLVDGLDNPFSLAVSPTTLYWTNTPSSNGHGTILSYSPL